MGMGFFTRLLDWIGRLQIIQGVLQNLWALLPLGWFLGTGVVGYMTGQPLMWIMVAVAAVAAFVCVAMFAGMMIQIWKDPENKLKFVAVNVGIDFQKQKINTSKRIEKTQVMMQLRNDAHFPMSIILEKAESSIEEHSPPRGVFPRAPAEMGAGAIFFLCDDPINMQMTCKNLSGYADFDIKYGKKGTEKYFLKVKGNISVSMNPDGSVRGIWFSHLA